MMSHSAMSSPLIACSTAPPRPCQKLACRRVSVTRSGSTPDWPFSSGQSNWIAPSTSVPDVKQPPPTVDPLVGADLNQRVQVFLGSCPWGQPPSTVARSGKDFDFGDLHGETLQHDELFGVDRFLR